jgi:outer membrane lipoprotein-sorting protein
LLALRVIGGVIKQDRKINMKNISIYRLSTIWCIAVSLLIMIVSTASAATIKQETLAHLERIKAIKADRNATNIERSNKTMDAA